MAVPIDDGASKSDHEHDHEHGPCHGHGHVHDHGPEPAAAPASPAAASLRPEPPARHGGGHHHHHGPSDHHHSTIQNLKLALALNLGFSLVELAGGFWTGSVAVMSGAIHDLSDALAIGLAFVMERLGDRQSNARFSYGYRRLSLLSALATCSVVLVAACVVLARAIPLLTHPATPRLGGMAGFAVLGVVVNGYAALRLARGQTMNERVVSWHMLEDVLSWATVLLGAGVMMFADLPIIDPILCILSSLFILWGVARSLKGTLTLFLQASPEGVDLAKLRREIERLGGVLGTHDAHLWSLDGRSHVLTLHVVVAEDASMVRLEEMKRGIRALAAQAGQIHVTVEMESVGGDCPAVDCVRDR